MASDPKAELRQLLADKLLSRWVEEGYAGNVSGDLPYEGQCEQIAGWVADMFTVEEDYQAIEDQRLGQVTPAALWHRRLIAKTDWQPTAEPEQARQDRESHERTMAWFRANGIDPGTVVAQPAPDIDVLARTITVHHAPPAGTGATAWKHTYPMNVLPEGW